MICQVSYKSSLKVCEVIAASKDHDLYRLGLRRMVRSVADLKDNCYHRLASITRLVWKLLTDHSMILLMDESLRWKMVRDAWASYTWQVVYVCLIVSLASSDKTLPDWTMQLFHTANRFTSTNIHTTMLHKSMRPLAWAWL